MAKNENFRSALKFTRAGEQPVGLVWRSRRPVYSPALLSRRPLRGSCGHNSTASAPAIRERWIAAAKSLAMGLAASLVPALRALKVAPVETLREECPPDCRNICAAKST